MGKHSIRFKITLLFAGIICILIVMLLLFNITFSEKFYMKDKQEATLNADRDEYPPAVFEDGGKGASVQYIDASDNRGSGSSMRHQMEDLPDGTEVTINVR